MAVVTNEGRQDKSPVARFYDTLAPIYARLRDFGHKRDSGAKNLLITALAPFEEDVVLDIGTGPGVYAIDIAKHAPDSRVVGIDISEAFIGIAARRAGEAGLANISFALGNIEQLDFEDASFTKIICAGVLSVVKKRRRAVAELARVLAPGGRLAVREPRRSDGALSRLISGLPEKSGLRKTSSRMGLMFGHFSPEFMTETEIRALFDNTGLAEVEFQRCAGDVLITAVK